MCPCYYVLPFPGLSHTFGRLLCISTKTQSLQMPQSPNDLVTMKFYHTNYKARNRIPFSRGNKTELKSNLSVVKAADKEFHEPTGRMKLMSKAPHNYSFVLTPHTFLDLLEFFYFVLFCFAFASSWEAK